MCLGYHKCRTTSRWRNKILNIEEIEIWLDEGSSRFLRRIVNNLF